LFGFIVASPAEIEKMNPDVVLISSFGHSAEIEKHLQPFCAKGVEIFSVISNLAA
jgi:hypothetical protein